MCGKAADGEKNKNNCSIKYNVIKKVLDFAGFLKVWGCRGAELAYRTLDGHEIDILVGGKGVGCRVVIHSTLLYGEKGSRSGPVPVGSIWL